MPCWSEMNRTGLEQTSSSYASCLFLWGNGSHEGKPLAIRNAFVNTQFHIPDDLHSVWLHGERYMIIREWQWRSIYGCARLWLSAFKQTSSRPRKSLVEIKHVEKNQTSITHCNKMHLLFTWGGFSCFLLAFPTAIFFGLEKIPMSKNVSNMIFVLFWFF